MRFFRSSLCAFFCVSIGSVANAADYRSLEQVLGAAYNWSQESLEFSRYRWEQESAQVITNVVGELVHIESIPVYAPNIEVINDVAVLLALIDIESMEGRSFSAYDDTCRFNQVELTVLDHMKSTALSLAGHTAISGQGSVLSIEFDHCVARVTINLHTWNEAALPDRIASPREEPPPIMRRTLPSSDDAVAPSRPRQASMMRPTPSVMASRTMGSTITGSYTAATLERDSLTINFPDSPRGDLTVSVKCEASVTRRGTVRKLRCWGEQSDPFVGAIHAAIDQMHFEPAHVDGKSSAVVVPLTVAFSRTEGGENVKVFENHNLQANYTAPQRYKTGTSSTCGTGALWQTLSVDESGRVESVNIDPGSASNTCVQRVAQKRLDDRYIPAMSGGAPVKANIIAIFES